MHQLDISRILRKIVRGENGHFYNADLNFHCETYQSVLTNWTQNNIGKNA